MSLTRLPWFMGVVGLSIAGVAASGAPQVIGTRATVGVVGDANNDGIANALDLQILQLNLGKTGTRAQGDFNGDGLIDTKDLTLLNSNFQRHQPAAYFGKVADTLTSIPSGTGTFSSVLNAPVVDKAGNLAFSAGGPLRWGVYRFSNGVLSRV